MLLLALTIVVALSPAWSVGSKESPRNSRRRLEQLIKSEMEGKAQWRTNPAVIPVAVPGKAIALEAMPLRSRRVMWISLRRVWCIPRKLLELARALDLQQGKGVTHLL